MRVRKNIKRKRKMFLTKSAMIIFSMCLIVGILVFADRGTVRANEESKSDANKYYKSIQIETGDTLWSIAGDHKDKESIREFIDDVMEINNLESDDITACNYLTVPYYSADYIQ